MSLVPILTQDQILLFLSYTFFFFIGGLFFLRHILWNIFDPLILLLLNISFNIGLILTLTSWESPIFYYFLSSFALFLLGLRLNFFHRKQTLPQNRWQRGPGKQTTIFLLVVITFFYIIYDIFIISQTGWGIFSGVNPDTVKVTVTQGGYGLFNRLTTISTLLYLPLMAQAYFIHRLKFTTWLGLGFYLFQNIIFGFSKAGFFFIIYDIGLMAYYYQTALGRPIITRKFILITALVGLVPAILVLIVVSNIYQTTITQAIITRLIATGSGSYMYFTLGGSQAFTHTDLSNRLLLYFDNILSGFRLKSWAPLGYMGIIGQHLTGVALPGFGANPYLFLDGHFLLGWFGIFYALALGLLINFVRHLKLNFIYFYIIVKWALYLPVDTGITQSNIIAFTLILPFILFLYLISAFQQRKIFLPIIQSYHSKRLQ